MRKVGKKNLSIRIPRRTAETAIEANYQINLKRWLAITPDVQYIIRPSGRAIGNALVLGTQAAISFSRLLLV